VHRLQVFALEKNTSAQALGQALRLFQRCFASDFVRACACAFDSFNDGLPGGSYESDIARRIRW
jgi:hypothetical protein